MKVSVEKTPKQKMSQYVVDTATSVSITHLPKNSFETVIDAAIEINQQAGSAKAIPHIGARNLYTESELHENIIRAKKAGINKVLIIGGSSPEGKAYRNALEVHHAIADYGFEMLCGVYPQDEDFEFAQMTKYSKFSKGITQMCLNPRILNKWQDKTIPGLPTNCSVEGLYKYLKICGLTKSIGYIVGNLAGVKYIDKNGFNTQKFADKLIHDQVHLYNFGRMDQTLLQMNLS